MPAYVLVDHRAPDESKLLDYRRGNTEIVARHGGRFLVRGGAVSPLEGGWDPQRVVVIEFPDAAAARGWYEDPDYQPLKAERRAHSETRIILVEGV